MAAPTYPTSSDVVGGQPTLASHYNSLRADALRAGATAANAVNLGELLAGYSRNVRLEYLANNRVRVPYASNRVPALVVSGYLLRLAANADLPEAPVGAAATYYVFANRSAGSTAFTLSVNTSPTEAEDQRCIGEFYWSGTAVRQGSVKSYEAPAGEILLGADAQKSGSPSLGDVYIASDTYKVYFCFSAGYWLGLKMGFFGEQSDGFAISGGTSSPRELSLSGGDLAIQPDSAGVLLKLGRSSKMTSGLCLTQGTADDEILALKSSDVAHGMTDLAETDTYGGFKKYSGDYGGVELFGLSEYNQGVALKGLGGSESTAKSTAAGAAVQIHGLYKSGSSAGDMSANANILAVRNNATTRFILDADGDSHQDVGTAWTNFDDYDDAALLTDLSLAVSQEGDAAADRIRAEFGEFLRYNRQALEGAGLVRFNPDGHHFVNMSRLSMLLTGALRQQSRQLTDQGKRLARLERRLELSQPLDEDIQGLAEDSKGRDENIQELTEDVLDEDIIDEDIQNLTEDILNLNERVQVQTKYVRSLSEDILDLTEDVQVLVEEFQDLTEYVRSLAADLQYLAADIPEPDEDIQELTEYVHRLAADVEELDDDVQDLTEYVQGLAADVQGLAADVQERDEDSQGLAEDD